MDGTIRSFLKSKCFWPEMVRPCADALEKQGVVRLAHLQYLTFQDLIDLGIPKRFAKVFDQGGFLQTSFSMEPSTTSSFQFLHSLKRNTSLQYDMESQQRKVKRQRTAKKYLSSKQMSLANIAAALPTEYVYGWESMHDLNTFMDAQKRKLKDWKARHGASNRHADGLIIFVLQHIYKLHFELPLTRANAQTMLNSQACGISSYAFTNLHFGFNIGLSHLETLNYSSGNVLLNSLERAYARLAATKKNVDPKVLTIARVTAQVAPDVAADVYGDMSRIYPHLELEEEEAYPQLSLEDNEATPDCADEYFVGETPFCPSVGNIKQIPLATSPLVANEGGSTPAETFLDRPKPLDVSRVARALFTDSEKKQIIRSGKRKLTDVNPVVLSSQTSYLRVLKVSEISSTRQRFIFEGKVLNVYGTFDSDKYKPILRTDLTDEMGFGIVTLVFGENHYKNHLNKINVGSCIRVEGAVVVPRTPADGGTIDFSLHCDATTSVTCIDTFETTLFFVPELSIRAFLTKTAKNPSFRSTIAFVIVQVDSVRRKEGGLYEQLTIADGPTSIDRATLTFVTKRKALYYQLVDEFHRGTIVPYIAKNIGRWKERSNTLSILDMTLVSPLIEERRKKELLSVFYSQVSNQEYGKELFGDLYITNFNGSLLVKKCVVCKGQNLNSLSEKGFCFSCGSYVDIKDVLHLVGEIKIGDSTTVVTISGDSCDKVLRFDKPLVELYKESVILTRVRLSETVISGHFFVDTQGEVIGFRSRLPSNV